MLVALASIGKLATSIPSPGDWTEEWFGGPTLRANAHKIFADEHSMSPGDIIFGWPTENC